MLTNQCLQGLSTTLLSHEPLFFKYWLGEPNTLVRLLIRAGGLRCVGTLGWIRE